ncbi:MAG: NADH-quinone oxidoreductase subunit L [Actinobacteria bacterium]|nr:NADH-quinone oxidoreductase subunit L [Actinomycetota bacterium]
MQNYVWLIPALPFAAFVVTLLLGRWWIKAESHWIPILAMAGSFGLSIAAFIQIRGAEEPVIVRMWQWFSVGSFQVPLAFQIDQLTAVMLLVVTGVGLLIFIYSKGYMHGDPGYYRFFAYMSLFAFSMLLLVLANNYLLLYFGWEAVGLCSYYLIGFFYHKPEAAAAGKKAFIVNRVGDFGFGLGVMLIFVTFGTLDYTGVFAKVAGGAVGHNVLVAIALLLFMGAMGKSAQFPLHVWLPDAMEGPTPVSALIHAATMVTAGVYLVARSSVIFASAPAALLVVGIVGTFTAIFAAVIGMAQNDIKKVLAYSTVSQLGYMFMALGVGAWSGAIFHLVAHAFFKALLFLGAGSVIHSMGGEQDMRCMGGLARRIPVTWITFMTGALALSGVFPFAGFWSKDEILGKNFQAGVYVVWFVGLVAAFITAFYTFRMVFVTFWGKETRSDEKTCALIHESPKSMTWPLILLAVASTVGGFIGLPGSFGVIQRFLEPVFSRASDILGVAEPSVGTLDIVLMVVSLVVALMGMGLAWLIYVRRAQDLPQFFGALFGPVYRVVYNKFYVDEFYAATFVRVAVDGSRSVWHNFDEKVIDGAVHGSAWLWQNWGRVVRPLQTGRVQNYLLGILIGVFVIVTVVVFL